MEEKETIVIDIQLDAKGVADQLAQVNKNIADVKAQNASLRKEVKDGTKTWRDVSEQLAVNEQRLKTLTTTQKVLTNQYNAQVGTNKRLGDSLKEMGSELTALKNEYRSLSAVERESAKGQELLKHIQDLDAVMKEADYTMGDHQRNVGNYPDAVKPVTAQLKEMTQALIQLRMEGKANTEEYNELLKKTGEMKDAMMDAQAEVKQMASDTGTLNSVLDGAKAAAGAFSVALGVMNLVGDKDSETAKELAEAQRKLQAAIAVTTGLQAVQNALQKESALMMGVAKLRILAATAAQKLYAAATRDAAAAQTVFNKVAKSNIYVWLASVILSVVGAIAAFTGGSKDQREELEKVNFELKRQLDYLKELTEAYRALATEAENQAQRDLDLAKARGASLDEIREKEDALLKAKREGIEADKERLGYSEQEYNLLAGKYAVALDEYARKVEATKQITNAAVLAMAQQELETDKAVIDSMKERLDLFNDLRSRMHDYRVQYTTTQRTRREEDAKTTEDITKNIGHLRRETQELIEISTSEELYAKIEERNRRLAESIQKVADRVGLLKAEFESLKAPELKDLDLPDFNVDDSNLPKPDTFEEFSASFLENADAIMETSSALESSFGSLSSMYQNMAKDESKSEEERAEAARKAKAWAKVQIATNAATAVAKGVASAVDVGFPAAIPAIATMLAAVLSAIAQAKALASEAGSFDGGGAIGGFKGARMGKDDTVIHAKVGEMVFNAEEQARVFDALSGRKPTGRSYVTADEQRQLFALATGKAGVDRYENGGVIGHAVPFIGDDIRQRLDAVANGGSFSSVAASLASAISNMPAPVLVYSEFRRFTDRVATLDDAAKLH